MMTLRQMVVMKHTKPCNELYNTHTTHTYTIFHHIVQATGTQ